MAVATDRELYNAAQDPLLKSRVQAEIAKYAAYILGLPTPDATLLAWAKKAISKAGSESYADAMMFAVVADPNYAAASADTAAGDTALQGVVQTAVNNTFKNL